MSRPAACAGRSGGAAKCRSNARHYAACLDSATPAGGWLHMGRSTLETAVDVWTAPRLGSSGRVLFSAPLSGRSRGACAARAARRRLPRHLHPETQIPGAASPVMLSEQTMLLASG